MTKQYLLTFKCTRCGRLFWSWFEVIDDLDKKTVERYFDEYDTRLFGDHVIRNQRACKKCNYGVTLEQFTDLEENFGLTAK